MENTSQERWQTWYEEFDEHHSPKARSQWYSSAANAYRWARPTYPDSLIDSAIEAAGLRADVSSILEIGCGPGIATASLAERGLRVQAIEPSAAACELARKSCQAHEKVNVYNSTFEDYLLNGQVFDAVVAATSFHWVSPAVACSKSAAALKPGGALILLWATPPQPSSKLCQQLQPVYDCFGLSTLGEEQQRTQAYYQQNFETFAHTVADSGYFELTDIEIKMHTSTYSAEKYLALLSTLSPYIALDESVSVNLFKALGKTLVDELNHAKIDSMEMTHWFATHVAPLKK
ncbi:MAG: class I SAM-dependent methyltransferase [Cyanobacteria bacterium J06634_5]